MYRKEGPDSTNMTVVTTQYYKWQNRPFLLGLFVGMHNISCVLHSLPTELQHPVAFSVARIRAVCGMHNISCVCKMHAQPSHKTPTHNSKTLCWW